MAASDRATAFIESHDPADIPQVATDRKTVVTVSAEVLRAAHWSGSA